jgi:1-acyl-sn-glycerol-3-phosphate acyltransferase
MLPAVEPVYGALRNALVVPTRLALRWTIEGAHRIPVRGPVILASNHVSYIDPLALAYVTDRRHRRVRFLTKAELFDKQPLGFLLRQIHQIPVVRNSSSAAGALELAVEALRRGECVAIFPEGTISLDLDPMPGKSGAARLAAESGVPVTPVGLWGAHRILFKGRKPRWRWGVGQTAVVGTPVRVHANDDTRVATDRIMSAIAGCVARAREIYPQRPGPREDDWWVRRPETARLRSAAQVESAS